MPPKERFTAIRRFVMRTNKGLKTIAKELGMDTITTYTARHTFSYIIMGAGASTEILQDALGHAGIQTTEYYKSGFSLEVKKKYSKIL